MIDARFTDEPAAFEVLADALEQAADQRRRAGLAASAELEAERRGGKDVRSGALRIVRVLAEASICDRYAKGLRAGLADLAAGSPALPLEDPEAAPPPSDPAAAAPPPADASAGVDLSEYSPLVAAAADGAAPADLEALADDADPDAGDDELEPADAALR